MSQPLHAIHLYTDGACSGNPGPGGWGCVLVSETRKRRMSGFEAQTTNNRMELTAVIRGLECLAKPSAVLIVTDSQYVKNAFTEGWLEKWHKNGWRTAQGSAVKNQDLWRQLQLLQRQHALSWQWVKGHSGHHWNEVCDTLAREAIVHQNGVDEANF